MDKPMTDIYRACYIRVLTLDWIGPTRFKRDPRCPPMHTRACNCGACQCEVHQYLMGDGRCSCGQP